MSGQPSKLALALNKAIASYQAGQFGEAEEICQKIISTKANLFDAHHVLAVVQASQGKNEQALVSYNRAVALQPNHADALSNRGNLLKELRRFEEALASFNRALDIKPTHTAALNNRGVTLHVMHRYEEALASFECAIALKPDNVDALCNRGNTLDGLKRHEEALASFDRALALQPNALAAIVNRGNSLREMKRLDEALASYDRAIAIAPNLVEAHGNRAVTLAGMKRYDEALTSFAHAIARRPGDPGMFNKRAVVFFEMKRFEESLADCDRALALWPDFADAVYNRGNALHELRRYAEALTCYERLPTLRPDDADTWNNRGKILKELDRYDEALDCSARALAMAPDNIVAHCNEASMRLLTGDFARGFAEYEWRWKKADMAPAQRQFAQPAWLGEGDIAGKTILLHGEQGFGDAIQFCRYAPLVAARGARVILEVRKPLVALMAGLTGPAQVVGRDDHVIGTHDALPKFDMHCPLISLPLAMGTRLDTVPAQVPYLGASQQAAAEWKARLGAKTRPRIGFAWAGNVKHERDRDRSMSLENFLRFTAVDATFVSLHPEVSAADAATLSARGVLQFGALLKDFTDTAALISQLDLVVSVDTSVAHLAGALGKPAWVLITYVPDWRWLLKREDSPWYPTMRLFRQDAARTWDNVIPRVHAALGEFVGRGSNLSSP